MLSLALLVLVYLFLIGYLGYRGWRGTRSAADYMVAGRNVHPFVMALSYGATFISTSAIVGFGGVAAIFGMGLLWLTFLNIFVGIFIAFVFLGGRTRAMGHHLDAHTFPEFLARRFDSRFLQVFSGLVIILFMPLYTSGVLMGAASFLDVRLGCGYEAALFFFATIVALYVIMGGLKGVMYTDALQGGIMFLGMGLVLFLSYYHLGGVVEAHETLSSLADKVPAKLVGGGHRGWTSMPAFATEAFPYGTPLWWTLVSSIVLGVGIGVLAQPQLAVRYMTVRSRKELNRAVLIGGVFILMMTGVAFVVGALSNVYFLQLSGREIGVAGVPAIAAAKGVVKDIIPLYMKEFMPVWLGDIFLISLLAAAMSTVSSQFHAMGTAMGRDVWETLGGAKSEGGRSLVATRLGIFLTFILAVSLAYILPVHLAKYGAVEIIARSTAIFFALCAATFLPMYVGGLYCRGITKAGAISGALVGFVTSAFWLVFVNDKPAKALGICQCLFGKPSLAIVEGKPLTWLWVDAMIVAFPLALVTTIVVSLATRSFSKEHLDHCFARID